MRKVAVFALISLFVQMIGPGAQAGNMSAPESSATSEKDVLSGDWAGVYQCRQGHTAVVVRLALGNGGNVSGTFTFGNLPGRTNAKEGEYVIVGMFDAATNHLSMRPNGWIRQPDGYSPVGFTADLDGAAGRLTGHVDFTGCSRISIDRLSK
jgi:hypothetical protein